MRNRTMASRRWAASCPGASGPPVQGARIPWRRSAPHASGRITGGARRGWVGGVNAMGRGGDPGVPGVRQGGGTGDPGSGARGRQRGTMGAPRHAGAHDPAGQGAVPVMRPARDEGLDLLLLQPFCGRAGHPILRGARSFHDHDDHVHLQETFSDVVKTDKTGLSKTAHTRWMISAFANFLPGSTIFRLA